MSKYTTQVRWVVEDTEKRIGGRYTPGVYSKATYDRLGLMAYPIFNEKYRDSLNKKIVDHFYFREIGFETLAQFSWQMKRTMNEIMPYYNQLYESLMLVVDPVNEINVKTTEDMNRTSDDTTTASADDSNRNVFQDTPMSMLDDEPSAVEQLKYATNVTYDNGSSDSKSDSHSSADQNIVRHEVGHRRSQSNLLKEYRETFINVDAMILEELEDLFMGLW